MLALNDGWRFATGDHPAAKAPAFNDGEWSHATLPHSFNAGEDGSGGYYRGPGWYRRAFTVAAIKPGRRLFIQFDAAATSADVWLNGRHLGRHEGGYSAFRFDLTDALVPGRNLLAVRVDNSTSETVSPLGGDFTVFGGLYRSVSLIETDQLHFDMFDHGGPGVYARASELSSDSATISLVARVAAGDMERGRAVVHARILDAQGREVARMTGNVTPPAAGVGVARLSGRIASPRRWDGVRDPYLYRIVVRIGDRGDEVSIPLGIRSFRIDPAQGFVLNGKPYQLRGANLQHSARPGKGNAVTDVEIAEDFAILREMGSTGARLAHFQHGSAAYDAADRLGLAVWTEIGVNGRVEDTPAFRANAARQLRELIAQTYNHPSVVIWGIGNEVYADDPSVARVLESLQAVAREADPSRPTAYAHCCQADDHPKALVSDVIGFNRYFGWYKDQAGQTIGAWAEGFHTAHPARAFGVSEYGAGGSIFHQADPPGAVEPKSGWHPEQYQAEYHERNWRDLADKPYLYATFVWVAFDFASAGRNEGDRRGINDKGLVTYDRRIRKDAYYWYQANWSDRPMIHITSRRFRHRTDPQAEVKVYTNAASVTLLLNGAEVGPAAPQSRIARWKVRLREGSNRIEVRTAGGLTDSVEWEYRPGPKMVPSAR